MLPEFAASLPALAGFCQPAAGGAASLPSPLASGDGLCSSDGLPAVSGVVRPSAKRSRVHVGSARGFSLALWLYHTTLRGNAL